MFKAQSRPDYDDIITFQSLPITLHRFTMISAGIRAAIKGYISSLT